MLNAEKTTTQIIKPIEEQWTYILYGVNKDAEC